MINEDVKYLKFKTFLSTYCPQCHNGFNVERKGIKHTVFKAIYQNQEIDLKLSPYLDVFDIDFAAFSPMPLISRKDMYNLPFLVVHSLVR